MHEQGEGEWVCLSKSRRVSGYVRAREGEWICLSKGSRVSRESDESENPLEANWRICGTSCLITEGCVWLVR